MPGPEKLRKSTGIDVRTPPLLVTYHPVTLEFEDTERQVANLLAALDQCDMPIVFTYPNADTSGRLIIERVQDWVSRHPGTQMVANLGTEAYFALMRHAAAMVGNSSSGIIEAASFGLPVVNVGNRQRGREHGPNVIDVGYDSAEIVDAVRHAVRPEFRQSIAGVQNLYGDGHAAGRIVDVLAGAEFGPGLLIKHFGDLP